MQAGWEQMCSNVMAGLSGLNMVYEAAGMHASLLGYCLESLVLGDDLLGQAMRCVRGIEVNEQTLGLDTMREVCLRLDTAGNCAERKNSRRSCACQIRSGLGRVLAGAFQHSPTQLMGAKPCRHRPQHGHLSYQSMMSAIRAEPAQQDGQKLALLACPRLALLLRWRPQARCN